MRGLEEEEEGEYQSKLHVTVARQPDKPDRPAIPRRTPQLNCHSSVNIPRWEREEGEEEGSQHWLFPHDVGHSIPHQSSLHMAAPRQR